MNLDRLKRDVLIDPQGCWIWQKSVTSAGYGQLIENRKYWTTHTYAFVCAGGVLQKGKHVRHSCHNRRCCNPAHLSIGSANDNWHDSAEVHRAAAKKRRGSWNISGVLYDTVRNASKATGIHQNTIIKYTKNGVFDYEAYQAGCKKGLRRKAA